MVIPAAIGAVLALIGLALLVVDLGVTNHGLPTAARGCRAKRLALRPVVVAPREQRASPRVGTRDRYIFANFNFETPPVT